MATKLSKTVRTLYIMEIVTMPHISNIDRYKSQICLGKINEDV